METLKKRGRPRKDIEKEIEEEAGLIESNVATMEAPAGTKQPANEFNDEYTLEVIADFDPTADIFRIPKPDPRYHYRWLRDNRENLSQKTGNLLLQKGGWQLCSKEHCQRIGLGDRIDPDGSARIGEHVLAFMPNELWEKKEAAKKKVADSRMDKIHRISKKGDSSVGAADMHGSMKGLQTGKQLGMTSENTYKENNKEEG